MPKTWSAKDERQYKHIKQAEKERGHGARAAEIAARTVNKQRRKEGRTSSERTQGTGNPHTGLEQRTRQELYNTAKSLGIAGRAGMTKRALVQAIRNHS
jgi:hypothetical protein